MQGSIDCSKLLQLIEHLDLNKSEVARIAGVHPTDLSRWLSGARRCRPDIAERIHRAALAVWRTREMTRVEGLHRLLADALQEDNHERTV